MEVPGPPLQTQVLCSEWTSDTQPHSSSLQNKDLQPGFDQFCKSATLMGEAPAPQLGFLN